MSLRGECMTEWRAEMRSGVEPTPDWQDNLCEVLLLSLLIFWDTVLVLSPLKSNAFNILGHPL